MANNNFYGYGFSEDNGYIPKLSTEEQIQQAMNSITVNEDNELVIDGQEVATIEDKYVTGVAFDNENNTLTVTLNDGSTQSTVIELAEVTDNNTYVESVSFDNESKTLILTRNDGESVSTTIDITIPADTNTYVESMNFAENVLTLTRNDGVDISAEIDIDVPSSISDLEDGMALMNRISQIERNISMLMTENEYLVSLHATSAETIANMTNEEALTQNVTITSNDAIIALSQPKTFRSVNVIGGSVNGNTVISLNGNESAAMVNTSIEGTRGSGNGRVLYATPKMTIDGVTVAEGSTMYNVFEGSQDKQEAHLVNEFEAKNVTVDNPSLKHNVFNIYQVADNATIKVSNSYFNLDVANSNVMRLSNITNAENVNVVFENVDWTYENRDTTNASNNAWAGLVIIQPYGTDMAHNGDTSKYQTWNMTFRNCRYNGELVDANNFGTIKQVAYFYDLNKSGATSDVVDTINVTFE